MRPTPASLSPLAHKHPILNYVSQLDRGLSTSTWGQWASYADTAYFVRESLALIDTSKTELPEIAYRNPTPRNPHRTRYVWQQRGCQDGETRYCQDS